MLESIFQGDDDAHLPIHTYTYTCVYIFTNEGKGESRRKEEPGRGRMVWKERGERESIK